MLTFACFDSVSRAGGRAGTDRSHAVARSAPILLPSSSAPGWPSRRSRRSTSSSCPPARSGATSTTARTRAPPGAPPASTTRRGRRARPSSATATATKPPSSRSARIAQQQVHHHLLPPLLHRPPTSPRSPRVTLRINRDDGAVVYLNGTEVFRTNMPTGTISYTTLGDQRVAREHVRPDARSTRRSWSRAPTCSRSRSTRPTRPARTSASISSSVGDRRRSDHARTVPAARDAVEHRRALAHQRRRPRRACVYGTTLHDLDQIGHRPDAHHRARRPARRASIADTRYYYAVGTTGRDPGRRHCAVHVRDRAAAGNAPADPRLGARRLRHRQRQRSSRCATPTPSSPAPRPTDLWLMLGDNAYESGTDTEYQAAVFDIYPTSCAPRCCGRRSATTTRSAPTRRRETGPYYDAFTLPDGRAGRRRGVGHRGLLLVRLRQHPLRLSRLLRGRPHAAEPDDHLARRTTCRPPTPTGSSPSGITRRTPRAAHDSDTDDRADLQMRQNVLPDPRGRTASISCSPDTATPTSAASSSTATTGLPATWSAATHALDDGDGRTTAGGDGAYTKPAGGPAPHEGAVYVVAGQLGASSPRRALDHPAMFTSLGNVLGSVVLEIDGDRLDVTFVDSDAEMRRTGSRSRRAWYADADPDADADHAHRDTDEDGDTNDDGDTDRRDADADRDATPTRRRRDRDADADTTATRPRRRPRRDTDGDRDRRPPRRRRHRTPTRTPTATATPTHGDADPDANRDARPRRPTATRTADSDADPTATATLTATATAHRRRPRRRRQQHPPTATATTHLDAPRRRRRQLSTVHPRRRWRRRRQRRSSDGVLVAALSVRLHRPEPGRGALPPGATRTDPQRSPQYLEGCETTMLDVDGDGERRAAHRRPPHPAAPVRVRRAGVDRRRDRRGLHSLRAPTPSSPTSTRSCRIRRPPHRARRRRVMLPRADGDPGEPASVPDRCLSASSSSTTARAPGPTSRSTASRRWRRAAAPS